MKELIDDYNRGRTMSFLMLKYRMGKPGLIKVLNENQLHYNAERKDSYSDMPIQDILNWYSDGKSLTEIGELLGHPANAILARKILAKNKVKLRELSVEEVILDFQCNNLTKQGIKQKYNISKEELDNILEEHNIKPQKMVLKSYSIDKTVLEDLYIKNGLTSKAIAQIFNCSARTIENRLHEYNIPVRKTGSVKNRLLDHNFFSSIDTKEKAYLIGLLFTDGSISKETFQIFFDANTTSGNLLENIKILMNIESHVITYHDDRKNPMRRLGYTSRQQCHDLEKFGVIPNKTYEQSGLVYNQIPTNFYSSYLRGLLEGDGIYCFTTQSHYLGFCSYYEQTVMDFQQLISELLPISINKIYYNGSTYFVQWSSKKDLKILYEFLYSDIKNESLYHEGKHLRFKNYIHVNTEITD